MERKLASVQRILSIEPIDGADRIVKVTVLGWQCVTQKSNNFQVGDLVVYFEIDSLMPLNNPSFDFLKDPNKPDRTHHRMKTVRLKGQISQGMVLPLNVVAGPEGAHGKVVFTDQPVEDNPFIKYVKEGDDLSSYLGIEKYEPDIPAHLAGITKGSFPSFLQKTDETRIQAVPKVLENRKGTFLYVTEKLDGSSFTCWFYTKQQGEASGLPPMEEGDVLGHTFGVASRNLNLARSDSNTFWQVATKLDLEGRLVRYGRALALQGEVFGPGIQGNKLKRKNVELRIFNVYDLETKKFLDLDDALRVIEDLGLDFVPIITKSFVLDHSVSDLVKFATVKSEFNKDVWAEGYVFRPLKEDTERGLGRFSFKVINPEFLLKHGE